MFGYNDKQLLRNVSLNAKKSQNDRYMFGYSDKQLPRNVSFNAVFKMHGTSLVTMTNNYLGM